MARSLRQIESEIRQLSSAERDVLLRDLIADLEQEPEEDLEAVWLAESHRRYAELKDGAVRGVSASEVLRKARERLGGAR